MEVTKKLYYESAYETEFDGKVLSCEEFSDKGDILYSVVLDRTLFFPEEGGQTPDIGTIDGIEVKDVQIKDEIITHILAAPLKVGSTVHGKIDFAHRFSNMQQHTGEHIISGLANRLYGYDNVGFHLSDNEVTMDFNGPLTEKDIEKLEQLANEAIIKNIELRISYGTKEELKDIPYRSKKEIDGITRLVEIPGVDICACCAPHVKSTGEIGILKITEFHPHRGGMRLHILCGYRLLDEIRRKDKVIASVVAELTTSEDKLAESIKKMKADNQTLSFKLSLAKETLLRERFAAMGETQNAVFFEEDLEVNTARRIANGFAEKVAGYVALFCGRDGSYTFVICSKHMNCNEVAGVLRKELAAKGGGTPDMVCGSVTATREDILRILGV